MAQNRRRFEEALRRGRAYNEQEAWREAFQMYRVALGEVPQSPEAFAGLGEACFGLRMLDRALESYKRAARYSRGDIQYLQRVADLQERQGQLQEAAKTYMAAGELQLRQQNLDTAIANWQRAIRLEPGLLGAHRRLALVFQRQGNTKAAVREYLAIARTLQMRGKQQKALQVCQAALRLDPGNEDVQMAIDLVQHGEAALADEEPQAEPAAPEAERERDEMTETVRQIASAFEEERRHWQLAQQAQPDDVVSVAARRAQDELAEEIFREEDEEALYGAGTAGMSKLERDAFIGQGMDFQARGQAERAIEYYERAINGGLSLPAAYFTVGMLYAELGETRRARQALARAARNPAYHTAIRTLVNR